MDWILNNVAVGSCEDAADRELLGPENIGAILNVRGDEGYSDIKEANKREREYCALEKLGYLYLPLPDSTPATDDQFARGIAFIAANLRLKRKVLVHCGAGWGRSPSIVAAYLLFSGECANADSAITRIQKIRPDCFKCQCDAIHKPRIREFKKRLPEMRVQIESMMESFTSNLRIGMNP